MGVPLEVDLQVEVDNRRQKIVLGLLCAANSCKVIGPPADGTDRRKGLHDDRLLAVFMVIAESEIPIDCVVREAQGCDRNQSVGQKNDNPFKYIFRLCTFM